MKNKKISKKTTLTLFIIAPLLILASAVFLATKPPSKEFSIQQISSHFEYNPEWETSQQEKAAFDALLNETFFFVGKGRQSFAFCNEKNTHVIKFLKCRRLDVDPWLRTLSFLPIIHNIYQKQLQKKCLRKEKLLNSWKIAFEVLKEESGLIYLHLNKTDSLNKQVKVVDDKGKTYLLNLDDYLFCIQRRAKPTFEGIKAEMENHNTIKATQMISQLIVLMVDMHQKGIVNLDPYLQGNTGFLEDRAVHIDIGRFVKSESIKTPENSQKHLHNILNELSNWLESNYPELNEYLKATEDANNSPYAKIE